MNRKLFHKIYGIGVKTGAVKTAVVITKLSQKVFLLIYACGLVLAVNKSLSSTAVKYFVCTFLALAVNSIIRKVVNAPRPFKREDIKQYIDHEDSGSFPSNHAASAMVIAICCGMTAMLYNVGVGIACMIVLVLMAVCTGVSRIMVGVHYPVDVAVGWLVGGLFGVLFCCVVI
jgi:membrane-associated phospholipid phosphatase